ncbi:MDR family MFS transporter [Nocardia sp. NPDC088792]|uniref:MDR family MFS transporter n=1 Tax=Nocardia sp. NPDC088792 TaxID=3364332 RepID=UPI0038095F91
MTTAVRTQTPTTTPLPPGTLRWASVLTLGPILALLDTTIVSVGIGSIAKSLGSPMASIQWIATGYLLAIALVMPLSSWAATRFGAKRMWMASVAMFIAGSALCGLAWSTTSLIVFRVLQGLGGGMIQPIGQTVLVKAVGRERLAKVIGMMLIPITFAPAVGPVLGGIILSGLGWRWMFLLNVPIGIVALILAGRMVPADRDREPAGTGGNRLDRLGFALLAPGLTGLLYGLTEVSGTGGSRFGLPALVAGAVLVVGYGIHALRTRITPVIDLRLFADRGFAVAAGNSFLQGAVLYSAMLLLPLYFQQVRHVDALHTGWLVLPQALATAIAGFLAGKVSDRFSARSMILAGLGLTLLGTVVFTQLGNDPAGWLITASLVLRGMGIGIVMVPGMAAVYSSLTPQQFAQAAGTINVLNRVGGAVGTTVVPLILQHYLAAHAGAAGFGLTFWWVLGLSALAIGPALLYPGRKAE